MALFVRHHLIVDHPFGIGDRPRVHPSRLGIISAQFCDGPSSLSDASGYFGYDGKADLWIFYGKRDGVPTAFGYDYENKGKPALIVALNAVPQ